MKSLKLFLAVAFLFVFSAGLTFGQVSNKNKQVYTETFYATGDLVCTDDYVGGDETLVYTTWGNKMQVKGNGIFVGISGKIYEWNMVGNYMFQDYVPGKAYETTQIVNGSIYFEGQEIAKLKELFHITINAGGTMTANIDKGTWNYECL